MVDRNRASNRPTELSWDTTGYNDWNSSGAYRTAPNPPTAEPPSSFRYPSAPARPTTRPFDSNASERKSQKGSKKIVLFRALTTNDKRKKSSTTTTTRYSNTGALNSSNSRHEMNKRNPPSHFYDSTESSTVATPAVGPTIIRPQSSRKPKPPRPPPPKINGLSVVRQPPSYDDVFGAEVDAFIGEMRAPRPKLRAPPRPTPVATSSNICDTNAVPLIQFDDVPSTSSSSYGNSRLVTNSVPANGLSLLDLDNDFFMHGSWSGGAVNSPTPIMDHPLPTPAKRNLSSPNGGNGGVGGASSSSSLSSSGNGMKLGTRVLPPGPIPRLNSSSSADLNYTGWSRASLQSDKSKSVVASPPQLRNQHQLKSPPRGLSKGDDWLQSCLHGSTSAQNHLGESSSGSPFGSSGLSMAVSNTSVPQWNTTLNPPLPPRPRTQSHSDGSLSPTQSPDPPSSTPPPVPPLPFSDFDTQFDDAKCDVPPLPPRPKNYETSRPHAIAIYDYDATQSDELSFKRNNIIMLIHRIDESWLYGYTDDCEGIFPRSFVNIVVPLSDEKGVEEISGPRCLALYDFTAETESELSLCAGDVILLDRKDSNDWFHGTLNGNSGIFPSTFVEVLEDLPISGDPPHNHMNQSGSTKLEKNLHIAIYDFLGEEGELTFNEGTIINVTGTVNEEWIRGHTVGSSVEGHFPKSFVKKLNK